MSDEKKKVIELKITVSEIDDGEYSIKQQSLFCDPDYENFKKYLMLSFANSLSQLKQGLEEDDEDE